MEICSIISYFLDYKQDYLLNKLKNHFKKYIQANNFSKKKIEDIKKDFAKNISSNINKILPDIMRTGTSIDKDKSDPKLKESGAKKRLDLSAYLGILFFSLFCNN